MTIGQKAHSRNGLSAIDQGNVLDISEVWPLNGHQLPPRTSETGRFIDELGFASQSSLPTSDESWGFNFRNSPYAVPAVFAQVLSSSKAAIRALSANVSK